MNNSDKDKRKSTITKIVIVLLIISVLVGFLWKRGDCYVHNEDDGFVTKCRYEIIIDGTHGIRYEKILWHKAGDKVR